MKLRLHSLLFALVALFLFVGCNHRPLAPEGPYQGDTAWFEYDTKIKQTFLTFEAFTSIVDAKGDAASPEMRHLAEQIRTVGHPALREAAKLSQAYGMIKTAPERERISATLAVAEELFTRALTYLPPKKA